MGVATVICALAAVGVAAAVGEATKPPREVPGAATGGTRGARPQLVIKADKGFIDDPVALDPEGVRLAILRTDSASFAKVEIVDLRTGAPRQRFDVGDPQQVFEKILFAGARGGVVLITRDPATGQRSAQHFTLDGKALGHAGPATDFGVTERGGRQYLVAWSRHPLTSGATSYVVSQHRLERLTRVGKQRAYTIGRDGELASPPLKVFGWQDGYSQLVGQKPGTYDKAKDIRQPDRAAVVDALDGSVVLDAEIKDLLAWAFGNQLRRERPNRSLHAVISEQRDAVHLVDVLGRRTPLALAETLSRYDLQSLEQQEDPARRTLYFGVAVDPLHPEALARRKADQSFLDVYRARLRAAPEGRAAAPLDTRRLVRAPLGDRPVSWVASDSFVVLLRKHRSFNRGGSEIEVYPVPQTQN